MVNDYSWKCKLSDLFVKFVDSVPSPQYRSLSNGWITYEIPGTVVFVT